MLIKSTVCFMLVLVMFFSSHFIFSGTGYASLSVIAAFVCMDALPDFVPFFVSLWTSKDKKKHYYYF